MDRDAVMAEKAYLREQAEEAVSQFPEGSISIQLDRQRDILKRLDHNIGRLLDRLEPALGENYPRPGEQSEARPNMSPLATALYSLNDDLDELNYVITCTIDRIEL